MACVTATEVKKIMIDCSLTNDQIDPYILSAHSFIEGVLATNTSLSTATRKEIEKWFTAHLITSVNDKPTTREKVGEAEVDYAVKPGEGLKSTPYGEMVLMLDTSGLLAKSGKKVPYLYAVKSFEDDE